MNCYWFNRQELSQKKKNDNGSKEKAANNFQSNKDVIKKAKNKYRNLLEEEK